MRAGFCRRAPVTSTSSSRAARSSSSRPRRRTRPTARRTLGLAELGPELARAVAPRVSPCRSSRATSCSACSSPSRARCRHRRAVASQIAVGIKKIQLIERLTEKNLIKDFFDDLAAGRGGGPRRGAGGAARLRPRPAAHRARRRAGRRCPRTSARGPLPGSLFDRREDSLRGAAAPAGGRRASGRRRSSGGYTPTAPVAARDRTFERLRGRRELLPRASRRRVRRSSARPCSSARRRSSRSRSSAPTSTSSGSPPTAAFATRRSRRSPASPTTIVDRGAVAPADARGVPAATWEHQCDLRRALHPREHAAAAPAPDRRPLRDRPSPRRLADDRDRREARAASARARRAIAARFHIPAPATVEALTIDPASPE